MADEVIHREAKFGHSLCGKPMPAAAMSLNDSDVTCPECQRVLRDLRCSDTKTKLLKRMFFQEE